MLKNSAEWRVQTGFRGDGSYTADLSNPSIILRKFRVREGWSSVPIMLFIIAVISDRETGSR
jgi:hypothetical protein